MQLLSKASDASDTLLTSRHARLSSGQRVLDMYHIMMAVQIRRRGLESASQAG
jgi:hypothetical protein